jgi:Cu-Zn family superoxide dismutase
MMRMTKRGAGFLALVVTLAACGGEGGEEAGTADTTAAATAPSTMPMDAGQMSADTGTGGMAGGAPVTVAMRDAQGRDLGSVTLAESAQGITLTGTLRGLAPGEHGIHVHTTGRCEPPFESAGPHWNPTTRQHGTQNPQGPHFGDMPNLTVGADSSVSVQGTTAGGTLRGQNALLDADGAAVVIHAGADDYRTDPSGQSGDRIACGTATAS